jgi:hypothetical protein
MSNAVLGEVLSLSGSFYDERYALYIHIFGRR